MKKQLLIWPSFEVFTEFLVLIEYVSRNHLKSCEKIPIVLT